MVTQPPFATTVGVGDDFVEEDYAEVTPIHPNTSRQVERDADDEPINQGTAIKAYVVDSDEESTTSEIEALNVDVLPTRNEKARIARSKLRQYTIYSVVFIILLVIVIIVPLYFTVLKANPPDISDMPSAFPSVSPSQAPTSVLYSEYVDTVSSVSNPVLLMTPGTAQYRAIRWLYHDDPAGRRDINDDRLFQRYIAAVFYYSTSRGRGWHDCYPGDVACTSNSKKEWFGPWDECEWYGFVQCDENGFVTRFIITTNQNGAGASLHGNGLHGTLPSELGYLTTLKTLTIARNPLLTGSIPSTFSKLTKLRKLSLLFNNVEGPWSEGLLENMTDLTGLYLNYNDFNMTLPRDIAYRTSLNGIGLAGNKIHGSIPSEYGRLYELTMLELDDNFLTGALPNEIFPSNTTSGLPTLKYLDLQNNRLNGTIAEEIGNMKLIEKLYLSNNDFDGKIPESISGVGLHSTGQKHIKLDGNRFSGTIPATIGDISLLYSLNLTGNDLTGNAPETLCSSSNAQLKFLAVDCEKVGCSCCTPSCRTDSA